MSDLTDELLRMAAEGSGQARQLAVTDIIRQGNRRRGRVIAQRSIGGLSVLGVSAAVIFAGVSHAPVAPSSSTSARAVITLTETTSSAAATLTVEVKYRAERHDTIKVLSIMYTVNSRAAIRRPALGFTFQPASTTWYGSLRLGKVTDAFSYDFVRLRDHHRFAGSVRYFNRLPIHGGEELTVGLYKDVGKYKSVQLLAAGLVLNP